MNRQITIGALLALIAGYALRSHGLFALYHIIRGAELLKFFH
jgi:uncharacterized membrane protein (Fun14 family)